MQKGKTKRQEVRWNKKEDKAAINCAKKKLASLKVLLKQKLANRLVVVEWI